MKIYKSNIIPMTKEGDAAKYLIIKDEKIVYVGNDIPEEYSDVKITDLNDKAIIPGFFDTHTHFSSYGFFIKSLSIFTEAKSIDEVLSNLKEYISKNNSKFYILFGVSPFSVKENRLPTKEELDRIESKKPVFIVQYDGHAAIGNSALIKKIKISKDEIGFDFEKGHFFQDSFYKVVKKVTSKAPLKDAIKGIKDGADYAAKQGITSIVALQGEGFPLDMDLRLVKFYSKRLKIQVIPFFQTRSIKKIKSSKLKTWGGCFDCAIDGSFGSLDAALKEPYNVKTDIEGDRGKIFYDSSEIKTMLEYANKNDIQVAIHAIGDRGIEEVVNVFTQNIDKENKNNHRIEHALILSKEEIKKIAEYNIHIATQPSFLGDPLEPISLLENILGKERFKRFMPLREMFDAGIIVSGGSDAPVTMPSPIMGIYNAINHPVKEQCITIYEALEMFTINGAKSVRMEHQQGSLEIGKLADFVVLDKSPLKMNKGDIKNIKIDQVFKNGRKIV
jgi:hypothetical protein